MTRFFIQLCFKGTSFHGWQIQKNAISVQAILNEALSTILHEKVEVTGAGRTDTGVHAKFFIAHFDAENLDKIFNEEFTCLDQTSKVIIGINSILPADIAVQRIFKVKPDAHSRFNAISRTYEYRIITAKNPFETDFAWFRYGFINLNSMNKAASMLLNYQDFTSFSKLHTDVKTNNCRIFSAHWQDKDGILIFTIKADRFLRNMVRAIVGTLVEVGNNKISPDDFGIIIESMNRSNAGASVPAHGLFLTAIEYPDSIFI
jgi:tRNA pseudouridine38-40 synthase